MMYADGWYEVIKDRTARERAAAEERRLARTAAKGPNVLARMARGFFALAVVVDNTSLHPFEQTGTQLPDQSGPCSHDGGTAPR